METEEPATPAAIDQIVAGYPGRIAYRAVNLRTGHCLERDADRPVRTASVVKVPIMVEAFYQIAEGRLSWEERITLCDDINRVGGSGILRDMTLGLEVTLRDAVLLMIVLSDNMATNLVLDALEGNAPAVNARMRSLGFDQTTCFRKAFSADPPGDPVAAQFGLGRTTAREMTDLLAKMAAGELVSLEASAEMVDILKKQRDLNGIGRNPPQDCKSATKAGALDNLRNDVGLIFSPRGDLALGIFCDGQPASERYVPDNIGLLTISRISRSLIDSLLAPA